MGVDDPPPAYDSIVRDICAQTDEVREGTMFPGRNVSDQERRQFLGTLDLPPGVQEAILESCSNFPLRIWVIDNSGSMITGDGHKLVTLPLAATVVSNSNEATTTRCAPFWKCGAPAEEEMTVPESQLPVAHALGKGREVLEPCTRWGELADTIIWHAKLAAYLGAPTEFRLLNAPGGGGSQVIHCGVGDPAAELAQVERMVRSDPSGRTPLCHQISQVVWRIKEEAAQLRAIGKKCVLLIASDGAATDGEIHVAMLPLRDLPVWTVVRLCTDDQTVVEYWNNIDEDLELDMDVLDDLCGEAREVSTGGNGWLTYGAPLHRLREWGSSRRVL
jgi:hypothetical protein